MSRSNMATLQLQKYLEKNTIKHPTALLHFERQLSDFEQAILFLCVQIVIKTQADDSGLYYLNKSLVRAVMRQEDNHDYTRISDAIDKVSKTDLKFNFMGQDRTFDSYQAPLVVGRAKDKKRGTIAFTTDRIIEKLVKDPRVFSRLNIYFISSLADVKRGYSFYALFRDFLNRDSDPTTMEVTLDYWELRAYLGVDISAYPAFKAFKQWVLKPLIDAVNERTDLQLSYEPVKTGRKLTHLKVTIKPQAWQLQLFEAEHAERMVTELAKSFDGAVIENQAAPVQLEVSENKERASLIDKCVKLGITSKTVERALKAYDVQGVGEIIAHSESRFKKMDGKGEKYDAKNYLAKMLNEGVGVKTSAERSKVEKAKKMMVEREAVQLAKSEAQKAEEEVEVRFKDHQRLRAGELLKVKSSASVAELGAIIGELIPSLPFYRHRWKSIEGELLKLDTRLTTDRTIFNGYVVPEALKLWGNPEDTNLVLYRSKYLETA